MEPTASLLIKAIMNPSNDPSERLLISISDIFSILRRGKWVIFCCAFLCGALGVLWALMKPIRYQAEGTFREKGIKQSTISASSSLVQLLGSGGLGGAESEAASLMLSRVILKEVIEKLHLQAHLQLDADAETLPVLIRRNLALASGNAKNSSKLMIGEICCPLQISSLNYSGEIPLHFRLEVDKEGGFLVFDPSLPKPLGTGKLGETFHQGPLSFTLVSADASPSVAGAFGLSVNSLEHTFKHLCQILTVEPSKFDKSLLIIKFEHRNRRMASAVVNAVMECYQDYSKRYHTHLSMKQLDYLSERRDHLTENLTAIMQKHANFLTNDLYGSGFIESDKEMDFLAKSQYEYKQKLLDNELEIKRLAHVKPDDFAHYDASFEQGGDPGIATYIFSEMRSLKQQRDGLEIEIQKKTMGRGINLLDFFERQMTELKGVRQYIEELRIIKGQFQKGIFPDPLSTLYNDPRFLLKMWFERLQKQAPGRLNNANETLENLQFYLNNLERLFGVHERILQERLTHQQNPSGEYQGISLEVATDLYREYSKQVIQIEGNIRQNAFFIRQIEDPHFEITSLSAGLTDPISTNMIQKASELILNLRDEGNQSMREQERIKEELNLQRTFMTLHLKQMIQLMELNKELLDEKIFALQNESLELIHQSISLLEKNLQDYLESRNLNLEQERVLIKRHLENIHHEMAQLPQKWVSEQLLAQEVETNQLIVEEIAKLVETKNISNNLELIQSAPIDLALPPVHPVAPKAFLWGFLGFFAGGCLGSCLSLARSIGQGLTATPRHLEEMGCHVSGTLTHPLSLDGIHLEQASLATIRRLQFYFDEAKRKLASLGEPENKLLLLNEGNLQHFAPFLADLLAKSGQRVLVLDLSEDGLHQKKGSLIDYFQGKAAAPPIQKSAKGDWDCASLGGDPRFACEAIWGDPFQKFVKNQAAHYDWILAVSRHSSSSIESEILMSHFPFASLSLSGEKIDELQALVQFVKNHPQNKITFIFT